MKGKLRNYLLLVSLMLCACVISFGVFAATGVSIPGSLGYNGSNTISVQLNVEKVANYDAGGTLLGTTTKSYSETFSNTSPTFNLGANFSDLIFYNDPTNGMQDLVFKITVGNVSTSKRLITLNAPTSLPSGVTVSTESHFITFPLQTYMNAGESKTFMFGLTYSGSSKYQLSAGSMSITTATDSSTASTLFQHETGLGWYAAMGTNPWSGYNEPIKWFPIAVTTNKTIASSSTQNSSYSATEKTNYKGMKTCPTVGYSYYLVSQYILSTVRTPANSGSAGLPYNFYEYDNYYAKYYNGSTWEILSGTTANDYSVSNLRAYLTGSRTAYQSYISSSSTSSYDGDISTALPTFEEQYNVQNSSVYNYIIGRSQSYLYKKNGYDYSAVSDVTYTEQTILGKSTNTVDKFWALSYNEMSTFIGTSSSLLVTNILSGQGTSTAGGWWLRSPYVGLGDRAFRVGDLGCYNYGVYDAFGVRPAVQVACSI